ncbi:hypothetical protein V5O48_008870 [Marasmius crinis-equi]|uniref:Uncharacterized protein n=1 Tax=Marasmius crinis-equi TaxID=585013 RepID=A0ABR3FCS2_9AGAR
MSTMGRRDLDPGEDSLLEMDEASEGVDEPNLKRPRGTGVVDEIEEAVWKCQSIHERVVSQHDGDGDNFVSVLSGSMGGHTAISNYALFISDSHYCTFSEYASWIIHLSKTDGAVGVRVLSGFERGFVLEARVSSIDAGELSEGESMRAQRGGSTWLREATSILSSIPTALASLHPQSHHR